MGFLTDVFLDLAREFGDCRSPIDSKEVSLIACNNKFLLAFMRYEFRAESFSIFIYVVGETLSYCQPDLVWAQG